MSYAAWLIFIGAAILEVGGDATIRKGLRGSGRGAMLLGFVMLGSYGVVVNTVKWDFSKLLGVYVSVFAVSASCSASSCWAKSFPLPPGGGC